MDSSSQSFFIPQQKKTREFAIYMIKLIICIYIYKLSDWNNLFNWMHSIFIFASISNSIRFKNICQTIIIYSWCSIYMNRFSYMKDSSPAGKELIGFLASCKGRLNLFNTPPGTPEAETARDEFNDPSSTFGSRSDYSKPDPNSERCLISLRAGIEM